MENNTNSKAVLSEIDKIKDSQTPVCEGIFIHDKYENKVSIGAFNHIANGYTKDDIKYTLIYNNDSNRILLIWMENDMLHYTTKLNTGTKGYEYITGHFRDFTSNIISPFGVTGKIHKCKVSTTIEIFNAYIALRDLITDTSINIDEYNDEIIEYAFRNPSVKDRY